MKAVRLHEVGGPQNLRVEEIEAPVPAAGETLVRVRAAAFNRRDVFITQGLYPGISLPRTLGSDGAGFDEASETEVVIDPMLGWGANPHLWASDASILGMPHDGTFAQYVAVPKRQRLPKAGASFNGRSRGDSACRAYRLSRVVHARTARGR